MGCWSVFYHCLSGTFYRSRYLVFLVRHHRGGCQSQHVILAPNFLPKGRYLELRQSEPVPGFNLAENTQSQTDTLGIFYMPYNHATWYRFSASGKSTNLCRGRTRNLGCRRPVTNQQHHTASCS
ncbi:hypothetical protein TNCV_1324441 [Trichonephila clavipes]|nr:hypothetical protein TNCV_1324441 [Trichonephila clavipes]